MADEAMSIKGSEYYAMAKHMAVVCHETREAFVRCKAKYDHPEDCIKEGTQLLKCSSNLFGQLQRDSPEEFKAYADCLDYQGLRLNRCRDKQKALEAASPLS
jgi:hypothetical protein